jgi:hypothetical protein
VHSRYVSEQWQHLESTAKSPLWRAVDAIVLHVGFATVVPPSLRRLAALVPGLLLAGSLVRGLAALLWRSLTNTTASWPSRATSRLPSTRRWRPIPVPHCAA